LLLLTNEIRISVVEIPTFNIFKNSMSNPNGHWRNVQCFILCSFNYVKVKLIEIFLIIISIRFSISVLIVLVRDRVLGGYPRKLTTFYHAYFFFGKMCFWFWITSWWKNHWERRQFSFERCRYFFFFINLTIAYPSSSNLLYLMHSTF